MEDELVDVTKKSTLVFSGKIIYTILGFFFTFVVARLMGAEIYGRFMYIFTFVSFFNTLATFGFSQGLVSFLPKLKEENKNDELKSLISFDFVFSFILSLIIISIIIINKNLIATNLLNNSNLAGLLAWVAPILLLNVFIRISNGIFRGTNSINTYIKGHDFIGPIFKLVFIVMLYFIGLEFFGVLISYYLSLSFTLVYFLIKIYKSGYLGKINLEFKNIYISHLKFSFPLLLTGLLGFFINKTDTFMIGYFINESSVGIYNIALKVGTMSNFSLVAFITMFAPLISKLFHKGELGKLANIYKAITKWILAINLSFLSIILLFNENILLLFGEEFLVGGVALVLVACGQTVNAAVGPAEQVNIMTGYPQYAFYNNLVTVFINVGLNYLLIPIYGISGAAIASLVSVATVNVIRVLLVYKNHKFHPYNKNFLSVIYSITLTFIIIYAIKSIVVLNPILELFIFSFSFVVVVSLIYFLFGLDDNDKLIFSVFYKKIKGRK
jgi:O-antigen/teichoic acid export membrane protein